MDTQEQRIIALWEAAEKYSAGLPKEERSAERTIGFYDCLFRIQPLLEALEFALKNISPGTGTISGVSTHRVIEKALQDYKAPQP